MTDTIPTRHHQIDDTPTRIPGFVVAMGDAAEAAIRQRIPIDEAIARAAFALDAEYAAAGLPTSLDRFTPREATDADGN